MQHVSPHTLVSTGLVTAVYATPFSAMRPTVKQWPQGMTIGEIVTVMDCLPRDFERRGEVRLNGELVHRKHWGRVRPKASLPDRPVAVTFHIALQGGQQGGGGGKAVIGLVAALALTVATYGASAGFFATAGGLFTAGSISAKILAGAIGLVGALALGALSAPPAVKNGDTGGGGVEQNRSAAASGNDVLRPGGTLDRVVGTTKVFPKFAGEPVNALVGNTQDEEVEAVVVLDGPHFLDDIRANGETLEASEDVQIETREGWQDDLPLDLVTRYGRRTGSQIELTRHEVETSIGTQLLNQAVPQNSTPKWHGCPTRKAADEIWLRFMAPALRFNSDDGQMVVPVRLRFRRRGTSTWQNGPEIHFSASVNTPIKFEVIFKWDQTEPETIPAAPTKDGPVAAYLYTLAQTVDPPTPDQASTGVGWYAGGYFDVGSGSLGLFSGTEGSSRLRHVFLYSNRVEIFLDSATFPKDLYDIQFRRGHAFRATSFSQAGYTLSSVVRDFFWYYNTSGVSSIAQTRENITDALYFQFCQSIWNSPILPLPGYAAIAIKARNKSIDSISTIASGYVRDWDGTGWNTWTYGRDKIAAHFRDVLCGSLNPDPLPEDLVDDVELVAWRLDCLAKGYTCSEVFSNQSITDILQTISSCGYGRPYQSEIYSVIRDRDRRADPVVQVFNPRVARGFSVQKAFANLPDGFLITFRNRENDYDEDEVIVYREGYDEGSEGNLESVTYGGLDLEDDVVARAEFDLAQAVARSSFYHWEAPAVGLASRRGSLVALEHDILARHTGRGRVKEVELDPLTGQITKITIDSEVPVKNTPDLFAIDDIFAVDDVFDIGLRTAFAITRTNGVTTTHLTANTDTGETTELIPASPLPDLYTDGSTLDALAGDDEIPEISVGCVVVVGLHQQVYKRVIVHEMRPKMDHTIDFVAVDEAPELHTGDDLLLATEDNDFVVNDNDDFIRAGAA